ncbi:integral membrane protein, AcrB/AcrD/AcrF family [Legionella beliardensis]|uniref:Integral membrane protein, AcrB/AcrD/AcrF family n=1 Tax=Legionella beliardensis TaxID=91822 RepID=A0A378HYI6_9GAMM|nr:efflux RND transporter permease subunit [Legionella beliardensis]STX27832.1 integral membrane protein, AcrB/AcrD/AcrF family [Legionella beliardensis]
MKITNYFIKHPVTAIIFNCLIIVIGLLCFQNLPIREYPNISFPVITVTANYPNASPDLVENAVTNILEDRLAGIEGLEMITSESNAGYALITLTFRSNTSMDKAYNSTQDAISLARALLPPEVKTPLVEKKVKANGLPFIGISLESTSLDFGQLTHFAHLRLKNAFRSIPGIASVDVWGQPYTYEITLDPKKLFLFGINVDEVLSAINKSRISLPAGNFQNRTPSTLNSELKSIKDYENLLIKTHKGHPILLKSIAQIKLTTDTRRMRVRVNGHSGLVLSLNRTNDANPIEVSRLVRQELKSIQASLPAGMQTKIIIDQSDFIKASLHNIKSSIIEAILLVLIIVFLFLRNLRATIIPLITIPISLLGSLIFLKLVGFSINLMTLLAMVLAIGLVVDDAIIALENIWRHIEKGLSPTDAALKGAQEIGFAIVAMTFTLASVYMPIAFIEGLLGQLFIEFAVALAGSVIVSGIVALTLTPLMCAKLINRNNKNWWPQIDSFLTAVSQKYAKRLDWVLSRNTISLVAAFLFISISIIFYNLLPSETAPKEDRSLVGVYIPPVAGEAIDDLDKKVSGIEKSTNTLNEANNKLTFIGDWGASIILPLKPHNERKRSAANITAELKPKFTQYPSIDPAVWSWDTGLPGNDNAGSVSELALVISTPDSYRELFNNLEKFKKRLDNLKLFESTNYDLRLDSMGYQIDVDNNAIAKLGLTAAQIAKTIEVFFSGDQSIKFQKDSITYNLTIQGNHSPWNLDELYLTTPAGKHISLGAVTKMTTKAQPATLEHFKQMRSTTLHVGLQPNQSTPQAMAKLWEMAKNELPEHYKLTWTGMAKTYTEASHMMLYLLLLALVFIYAILAIQFENFIDPLIILFTVPLASSGALLFAWLFGQSLNIYSQVGLITLIGLISKHGILIVEFANQLRLQGLALRDAIRQACQLRFRPILMTTGAMTFGAIPLVLSHAAGAESRHAIGIILIGGLLFGTFFTLFVLPGIYYFVKARIKTANEVVYKNNPKESQ